MAARATFVIDSGKLEQEHRSYTCYAVTKNGSCNNNPTEYGIGPKGLRLCRRHYRMWSDERTRLQGLVADEHAAGVHGQGEDRKQFGEPHERGTYWTISCVECSNELASEELNVPPENVEQAKGIQFLMERSQHQMEDAIAKFDNAREQRNLAYAIRNYGESVQEADVRHGLWMRVTRNMEANSQNLVESTIRVRTQVVEELVNDSLSDDTARNASSRWARDVRQYTFKGGVA
jgi:ribosomal protein S6